MLKMSRVAVGLMALAAAPVLAAPPQPEPSQIEFPWELRMHYSFPTNNMTIDYDEKLSRVRVRSAETNVLVNDMYFVIQFADGTVWDYRSMPPAKTMRELYQDPHLGPATSYTTIYPLKDNVEVRYTVAAFDTRPFITMQLELENKGQSDIRVSALDPLVTPPSGITGLPQASHRHFHMRAGYPVFDKGSLPYMTVLSDPAGGASLALGVLPEGLASSGVQLEQQSGAWHGRVQSRFEPSIKVAPGQTLASDRVAIAHGAPLKADIDMYYAVVLSALNEPKSNKTGPGAWVSVADTEGLDALTSAVNAWDGAGVKHALIPAHWEGKPGSLKGGGGWPANIDAAANALKGAGAMAGITIDPLAADGGPGDATAQSQDGQTWVNPAVPSGQDYIRKRVAGLGGGFAFFVVAPSDIPNEVLNSFGISRAQANTLAIDLVEEAVGQRPVYPAAGRAVAPAEWADVAAAIGKFADYGKGYGPVRLNGEGMGELDAATVAAIQGTPAPIEIVGRPSGGARSLAPALKSSGTGKAEATAKPEPEKKKRRGGK